FEDAQKTIAGIVEPRPQKISLIPDLAMASLMDWGNITKVLMGAHTIQIDENNVIYLVNTIGTLMVIEFATQHHIPVFVIAEEAKIVYLKPGQSPPQTNDFAASIPMYAAELANTPPILTPPNEVVTRGADRLFTIVTEKRIFPAEPSITQE